MKPLKEFIEPSKFKSYEELEKKFNSVINGRVAPSGNAEAILDKMKSEPVKEAPSVGKTKEAPKSDSSDDDMEAYFRKIAEEG